MMEIDYQIRKSRGINWTYEEKEYLVQLCCQRARIIEDKRSDVHTLRKKAVAWKAVYDKFSAKFGRKRPPVRVKEQWKRMKIAARAELREKQRTSISDTSSAGIVVLGAESDVNRSKYCSESEELLSQVQAILNSEFPETEEADDTGIESVTDDVGDADPIVIKVESDMEDLDNSSQSFFDAELNASATNGFEELQTRQNSTPVPISILHTPNQNQKRYQDPQIRTGEPWDTFNTKLISQGPDFRKSSFSNHNSNRNNIIKKLDRSGSYDHQTDNNIDHNSEIRTEYARREHIRKMEMMEKEHQAKMEILKIERETALKKLRKAEFKLNVYNGLHSY